MKEIKWKFDQHIDPIRGKKNMIFSGLKNINEVIVLDASGKFYFSPVKIGTVMSKFNIALGFEKEVSITDKGILFIRQS